MEPTPTERMVDPTLRLAAPLLVLSLPAVLEGPVVEVLVPVETPKPGEEGGVTPPGVGRAL